MRQQLVLHLKDASEDPDCRAIILTGHGGNFCSGGQLQTNNGSAPGPNAARTRRNIEVLHDIVRLLSAGGKPTLAAVEGYAYGAGLSLASACDIVIAGEEARFCASFARVGLMADAGLIWSLPQRVGAARAREIMLSGRIVDAREAAAIALVNSVVPTGGALDATRAAAKAFKSVAPLAISEMKRILALGPNSLEAVLELEAEAQPKLTLTEDYSEGKRAFQERRAPVFRGV